MIRYTSMTRILGFGVSETRYLAALVRSEIIMAEYQYSFRSVSRLVTGLASWMSGHFWQINFH